MRSKVRLCMWRTTFPSQSEEKQTQMELDTHLKEKATSDKKRRKRRMKEKKNDLKRLAESDFSGLLNALALWPWQVGHRAVLFGHYF